MHFWNSDALQNIFIVLNIYSMKERSVHNIEAENKQSFLSEARVSALLADPQEQLTEVEQQMFLAILETRLSMQAPHELRALYIFPEGLQFCLRRDLRVMKELALMEATGGTVDLICSGNNDYDFADLNPVLSPYRKAEEMKRTAPNGNYLDDFARRWEDKNSEIHKRPGKALPIVSDYGKVFCYYQGSWRSSVSLAKIIPYDDYYPVCSKWSAKHEMMCLRRAVLQETDVVIDGVSRKLREIAIVRVEGDATTIEPYRFMQGTVDEALKLARLEQKASEIGCSMKFLLHKEAE